MENILLKKLFKSVSEIDAVLNQIEEHLRKDLCLRENLRIRSFRTMRGLIGVECRIRKTEKVQCYHLVELSKFFGANFSIDEKPDYEFKIEFLMSEPDSVRKLEKVKR